jgi:hypothetical protein
MSARSVDPQSQHKRWLTALAAMSVVALWWHGPIAQWPDYHAFADSRSWLGVPNAANVLSNLPFAAVGAWGMWRMRHATFGLDGRGDRPWWLFNLALICTAAGSAFYHWAPDNDALALDRLPIAWACAALLCGFFADRVHVRWAGWPALAGALVFATLSVAYWWWTERQGQGDLRAYLFVQLAPMLLVPATLWLRLPARQPNVIRNMTWWLVLGLYALAKVAELGDRWMLAATQYASGHMLKHLLAATAAACLVAAVARRSETRSQLL